MKLIRFKPPGQGIRLGLWESDDRVIDLTALDENLFDSFMTLAHEARACGKSVSAVVQEHLRLGPVKTLPVAGLCREHRAEEACLATPLDPPEVWAAGVTYERSRQARTSESAVKDVYERVYEAARPELFLKSTAARVVGPGACIGLRGDSRWMVPEPELALVLDGDGTIAGFTLGNDVSSRDIEGENPLYLPQAKIFRNSCSIGPAIVPSCCLADPYNVSISLRIHRDGRPVFEGVTTTAKLKKSLDTLVEYLMRDNMIFPGTVLLTGTGIVPPDNFTLMEGDLVEIEAAEIGTLRNRVAR